MYNLLMLFKDISENPLWKKQIQSRIALKKINQKVWLETNLFSPVWWLMVISFIVLWWVWWKLVDKSRLVEIVAYGLMVSVFSTFVDIFGAQNVLWGYPNRLIPLSPPLLLENFCVFPVIFMLIYQYFTGWGSYSVAVLLTAVVLAFLVEPLTVWLDIYQLHNWKFQYSFLLYLFMALFLKLVMNLIKAKQNRSWF